MPMNDAAVLYLYLDGQCLMFIGSDDISFSHDDIAFKFYITIEYIDLKEVVNINSDVTLKKYDAPIAYECVRKSIDINYDDNSVEVCHVFRMEK